MSKYVIGDIHGAYKALIQCLERCHFDNDNDTLIILGDVADGWDEVFECVEHLLTIKNLITIMGNHDDWFIGFLSTGLHPVNWTQGASATAKSYLKHLGEDKSHLVRFTGAGFITGLFTDDIPPAHQKFFKKMSRFYTLRTEEEYLCFVHGGFNRWELIDYQHPQTLMWDRELWNQAKSCKVDIKLKTTDDFSHIFIGHTQVGDWRNPECHPVTCGGVTNLDTGAGWSGKLTIMNAITKQYWQSDLVTKLYPDQTGRR